MAGDLNVSIALNGAKEFNTQVKNISSSIKAMQTQLTAMNGANTASMFSSFEKNALAAKSAFDVVSNSTTRWGTNLTTLNDRHNSLKAQITAQTQLVGVYNSRLTTEQEKLTTLGEALKTTAAEHGENSVEAQKAASAYLRQANTVNSLSAKAGAASAKLEEMKATLKGIEYLKNPFTQLSIKADAFASMCDTVKSKVKGISLAFGAFSGASIATAVSVESAFTGITKTVDATQEQFDEIEAGLWDVSSRTASSIEDIMGVAEAAGQLGIEADSIVDFTETVIQLGDATNITAEDAASSFARIGTVMNLTTDDYHKMGSSVVDLGNNFATTESEIVDFANRMSGNAALFDMSTADTLGFSAALTTMGVTAEAGGSAMSRVMRKIQTAVSSGGDTLSQFASVAGVSAEEFAAMWEGSPTDAVLAFEKGLKKMDDAGGDVNATLSELGITNVRDLEIVTKMASGYDTVESAIKKANSAWNEDAALQREATRRYGTTASKIEQVKNAFKHFASSIGETLLPAVDVVLEKLEWLADKLSDLPYPVRLAIGVFSLLMASLYPIVSVVGRVARVVSSVTGTLGLLTQTVKGSTAVVKANTAVLKIASAVKGAFAKVLKVCKAAFTAEGRAAIFNAASARLSAAAAKVSAVYFGAQTAITNLLTTSLTRENVAAVAAAAGQRALAVATGLATKAFKLFLAALKVAALLALAAAIAAVVAAIKIFRMTQEEQIDTANRWSDAIVNTANKVAESLPNIATSIANALKNIAENGLDFSGVVSKGKEGANSAFGGFVSTMQARLPEIIKALSNLRQAIVDAFVEIAPYIGPAVASIISQFLDFVQRNSATVIKAGAQLIQDFFEGLASHAEQIGLTVATILEDFATSLAADAAPLLAAGAQILVAILQGIVQALPSFIAAIPSILAAIVPAIKIIAPEIWNAGIYLLQQLWAGIQSWAASLWTNFTAFIGTLPAKIKAGLAQLPAAGKWILQTLWNGITSLGSWLKSNMSTLAASLPQKIKSGAATLPSVGKWVLQQLWNGIKSLASWLGSNLVSFAKSIPSRIKSGISGLADIGKNIVKGLWNGASAMVDWAIGKFKSLGKKILGGIKKALGIDSPSRYTAEDGVFLMKGLAVGIKDSTSIAIKAAQQAAGQVLDAYSTQGANLALGVDSAGATRSIAAVAQQAESNLAATAKANYSIGIDYERLAGLVDNNIYLDNRLVSRSLKGMGVAFV